MPAAAAVAGLAIVIVTSSVLAVHAPLLIVHLNTVVLPTVIPVTVVVGLVSVVIVTVPLTTLQAPVPLVAVLPVNCVLVTLHKA